MSEYILCDTEIRDLQGIKDALKDLGIKNEDIHVYNEGSKLKGWAKNQTAHVIIPARQANTGRDVGFEKTKNGTYSAWVYDYDHARGLGRQIKNGDFRRSYAKRLVIREAKKVYRGSKTICEQMKEERIKIRILL